MKESDKRPRPPVKGKHRCPQGCLFAAAGYAICHRMLLLLTRHSLETDNIYCCCFAVNAGFISDLHLGDAWRAFRSTNKKPKFLMQLFTSSKFRMNQIKLQLLYDAFDLSSIHDILRSLPNKHPSFPLHGATQLFNAAA